MEYVSLLGGGLLLMTCLLFLAGLDGAVDAAQGQNNDDRKHDITADFHGFETSFPIKQREFAKY